MIRVNTLETFPIAVTLIDETTGLAATGQTVYYDIRKQPNDVALIPPVTGVLPESMEPGIYSSLESQTTFLIYATCSGFITNTEEVIVSDVIDNTAVDISNLVTQTRHYNISVEDVIRTENSPTANQAVRNVPKGRTDYVLTKIKNESDTDWSDPDIDQGKVYAWYRNDKEKAPYKMGGSS